MKIELFDKKSPIISIVTATFNAAEHLPRLIASLCAQTCKNFEWVVADGGSTDGTLELLRQVDGFDVIVDSRPDHGVYDAINRSLRISSGHYYIVVGADDVLFDDAIYNFLLHIDSDDFDIISACVLYEHAKVLSAKKKFKFLYGQNCYVSVHAVGCLIKKSLHERFGFYSKSFPVGADFLFLKTVGDAGCRIHHASFISGEFGHHGLSNIDYLCSLTDVYRAQIKTGENKWLQTLIFFARLLKNWKKF